MVVYVTEEEIFQTSSQKQTASCNRLNGCQAHKGLGRKTSGTNSQIFVQLEFHYRNDSNSTRDAAEPVSRKGLKKIREVPHCFAVPTGTDSSNGKSVAKRGENRPSKLRYTKSGYVYSGMTQTTLDGSKPFDPTTDCRRCYVILNNLGGKHFSHDSRCPKSRKYRKEMAAQLQAEKEQAVVNPAFGKPLPKQKTTMLHFYNRASSVSLNESSKEESTLATDNVANGQAVSDKMETIPQVERPLEQVDIATNETLNVDNSALTEPTNYLDWPAREEGVLPGDPKFL